MRCFATVSDGNGSVSHSFHFDLNFDAIIQLIIFNFSLTRAAINLYYWNRLYRRSMHLEWYFLPVNLVNWSLMHSKEWAKRLMSSAGIYFQAMSYAFIQQRLFSYNGQLLLNPLDEFHAIETLLNWLVRLTERTLPNCKKY